MDLNQLKALIAQQDEAQRKAVESVRPAYEKALKAAHELRASVEGTVDDTARRERLRGIIEKAAGKMFSTKPELQMAGLVVAQHSAAVADQPGLDAALARDGKWLIGSAMNNVRFHKAEQRPKVVAALVVAASGAGVETGLIEFPQSWWTFPSLQNMEAMASLLNPEAFAAMQREDQEKATLLAEALRMNDALAQARPAFFAVGDNSTPLTVIVRSHRGGSTGMGGVTFQPGDNELTADQYAIVREKSTFNAYVEKGELELISTANLVEEL